jgi:urease accessory protein
MSVDQGATAYLLINPPGGLVGGDHLSIHAKLEAQAYLVVSTPSANRIYRSVAEPCTQAAEFLVGRGAVLEWVPELTIPFPRSRLRQSLAVRLEKGATFFFWEGFASGRVERGERYQLQPDSQLRGIGLSRKWNYMASVFVISATIEGETLKRLQEALWELIERGRDRVFGGVSRPAVRGHR